MIYAAQLLRRGLKVWCDPWSRKWLGSLSAGDTSERNQTRGENMNKGNVLFAGIAVLTMGLLLGLPIPSVAGTFWTDAFSYASQSNFEAVWDSSCPGNSSLMGPSANYYKNPSYSLRSVMNSGVN